MNEHFIYDPEDIESLMLHKTFEDLLADEKAFVLKHIASQAEYEHLRSTLLQSMHNFETDDFTPPAATKEKLIAQFKKKHRKPSFVIWLNGLFNSRIPRPFYFQPYFQLAVFSGLLVVAAFLFLDRPENAPLALEKNAPQTENLESITDLKQRIETPQEEQIISESITIEKEESITNPDVLDQHNDMAIAENLMDEMVMSDAEPNYKSIAAAADVAEEQDSFSESMSIVQAPSVTSERTQNDFGSMAGNQTADENQKLSVANVVNDKLLALLYSAR